MLRGNRRSFDGGEVSYVDQLYGICWIFIIVFFYFQEVVGWVYRLGFVCEVRCCGFTRDQSKNGRFIFGFYIRIYKVRIGGFFSQIQGFFSRIYGQILGGIGISKIIVKFVGFQVRFFGRRIYYDLVKFYRGLRLEQIYREGQRLGLNTSWRQNSEENVFFQFFVLVFGWDVIISVFIVCIVVYMFRFF